MSKCIMCGEHLPIECTSLRKYCDSCRKKRAAEADRRKADKCKANTPIKRLDKKIANISKAANKALKKKGLSLTLLLKSLDAENAKRRELGLVSLSYGKYVVMVESGKIN